MKQKIFVYGTLRKGMYNYDLYLKDEDSFRQYGYIKGKMCIRDSVKEGTTLYKAYGINSEMDKKQRWFDVLKINYKVPDMI